MTIQSFEEAFEYLDHSLPPRLSQIQDSCQSIENLEMERIRKVRRKLPYSRQHSSILDSRALQILLRTFVQDAPSVRRRNCSSIRKPG